MTQIEERAKKYCIDNYDLPPSKTTHAAMGYIQGATEQRQIDIEKVYHALEKILSKEMLDNIRKILEEES